MSVLYGQNIKTPTVPHVPSFIHIRFRYLPKCGAVYSSVWPGDCGKPRKKTIKLSSKWRHIYHQNMVFTILLEDPTYRIGPDVHTNLAARHLHFVSFPYN